jgi:hypothetical protein
VPLRGVDRRVEGPNEALLVGHPPLHIVGEVGELVLVGEVGAEVLVEVAEDL